MGGAGSGAVLRQVDRLFGRGTVAGLGEGQLLDRYLAGRDEVAFEALVARHGPMVLGVCRRLLGDPHDVEDAFQATFLVLVKKAGAIRDRDLLGPWLYGVAHRVAVRSRGRAAQRRSREATGLSPEPVEAPTEPGSGELRPVLDEEIGRLPEKYRVPILLCYFEGLSHDEAATNLRWPVGTVRSRLARGRDLLRGRLTRRGLAPVAGLIASGLTPRATSAAVPPALIEATVRAATRLAAGRAMTAGAVSASVAALTKGVVTTMFLGKLKVAAVGLVAAGIAATGAGVWAGRGLKASDGPDGAPAPLAGDLAKLQGKWEAIKVIPPPIQWQFRKPGSGKYTWEVEGSSIIRMDFERRDDGSEAESIDRGRLRLDEARTPKVIDFVNTDGSQVITAGIYKLEGDQTHGLPGRTRDDHTAARFQGRRESPSPHPHGPPASGTRANRGTIRG